MVNTWSLQAFSRHRHPHRDDTNRRQTEQMTDYIENTDESVVPPYLKNLRACMGGSQVPRQSPNRLSLTSPTERQCPQPRCLLFSASLCLPWTALPRLPPRQDCWPVSRIGVRKLWRGEPPLDPQLRGARLELMMPPLPQPLTPPCTHAHLYHRHHTTTHTDHLLLLSLLCAGWSAS